MKNPKLLSRIIHGTFLVYSLIGVATHFYLITTRPILNFPGYSYVMFMDRRKVNHWDTTMATIWPLYWALWDPYLGMLAEPDPKET